MQAHLQVWANLKMSYMTIKNRRRHRGFGQNPRFDRDEGLASQLAKMKTIAPIEVFKRPSILEWRAIWQLGCPVDSGQHASAVFFNYSLL